MVSSSYRRLLTCIVILLLAYSNCSTAQDSAALIEIARANGESMRNYDVSFKKTTLINFPTDPDKLKLVEQEYQTSKRPLWDEIIVTGRLLVDKETAIDAKRLLFVQAEEFLIDGKIQQRHTEFVLWYDGNCITGTTRDPSGELSKGKTGLDYIYQRFLPPSFETFVCDLDPPRDKAYWNDHSVYWDMYKDGIKSFKLQQLNNGCLRLVNETPEYIFSSDFDPLSMLLIAHSRKATDKFAQSNSHISEAQGKVTWENHKNVYRIKSILKHDNVYRIPNDSITTFHWHQFNENELVFPNDILDDVSMAKCTLFLVDGQSELSNASNDTE